MSKSRSLRAEAMVRKMDCSNCPWMNHAINEIGIKESSPNDGKTDTPKVSEYIKTVIERHNAKKSEPEWCSAFVSWCMQKAGFIRTPEDIKKARGYSAAGARSWEYWGISLGRNPRFGAITVLKRDGGSGHVGFYVGDHDKDHILLLGGNQSNQVNISIKKKT
jgi:uncharacterized protein (TIGR02594 family)